MKKFISILFIIWGGLVAFSNEQDSMTIVTFDLMGSVISFGHNNRIKFNLDQAQTFVEDFAIKDAKDLITDSDNSVLNNVLKNTDKDNLKPSFEKSSDSLGGGHLNIDFLFGSSHNLRKQGDILLFTLGVVGVDLTNAGTCASIEPEIGMEIDLALSPWKCRGIFENFWLILGARGLVGIDFIQNDSPAKLLTATIKPKISVGFQF